MKLFVYQNSDKNKKKTSGEYSSAQFDIHEMFLNHGSNSSAFMTFFDSIYNNDGRTSKKEEFCLQIFVIENYLKIEQDFDSITDTSKLQDVNCGTLIDKLRRTGKH